MSEAKPDFDDTGNFERRLVRVVTSKITSKMLWLAIGLLLSALVGSITWVVSTQQSMNGLPELRKSIAELVKQSQDTRTDVASIKATVNDMKEDERDRWARVDKVVAEPPPHARRRH